MAGSRDDDYELVRALYAVSVARDLGFETQVARMLEMGRRRLGMDIGLFARVKNGEYEVVQAEFELDLALQPGDVFPLGRTFCRETLAADAPVGFAHAARSVEWATHPAYQDFGLESYLGAPVRVDGRAWGTVNFSSPTPRDRDFDEVDREFVQCVADWVGAEIERIALERKLRRCAAELEAMHAASPLGLFMTDLEGNCIRVNAQYEAISGLAGEEALGQGWVDAIHPDDRERVFREWYDAATAGILYESDHRFRRRDGSVVWASVKAAALVEDGCVTGHVGTVEDITERKDAENRLQAAAYIDPLTGLPNRRLFDERLADVIERSRESGHESKLVALLMIDLDGFKAVNDSLGHEAGDALLAEVANRFRAELGLNDRCSRRSEDLFAARLGGDEFAVLLPGLDQSGEGERVAGDTGERLLAVIDRPLSLHELRGTAKVSASIGIAFFEATHDDDVRSLLRRADQAMYEAKAAGKNQVVVAPTRGKKKTRDAA
ncbi:MAG: diguanylate cyclase domain-containing protein [Phycisphaerales bacterium]